MQVTQKEEILPGCAYQEVGITGPTLEAVYHTPPLVGDMHDLPIISVTLELMAALEY